MATIACLHAARSNIALYEAALSTMDYQDIGLLHRVESDLLQAVMSANGITPEIDAAMQQSVSELCSVADAVIVTCTTLGAICTNADAYLKPVLRVDATLAKQAACYHGHVLVLCSAAATLASTRLLFETLLPQGQCSVEQVPDAWEIFCRGDIPGYYQAIASYIHSRPQRALACIVLAQVSMAGAARFINTTLAVLTGPQISLQAAIEAIY
ncbi:hypothetical protein BL250_04230 [Erwinia sp. OLTSP20]|uniref:hypothetical protein n=1 Tax=unclassified Erwinia TaxID=2622719 RepID=UPI000C1999DA|nr:MULTISPECIES: hypothetical protein [unclassified Erwinia]PIJ51704.1 hypothetical protein BV501_03160 [Erwinia sp. OAMSP11]PIJ75591.1 hypothetical protein BK416_01455 [Erwinia sp. OLSSP12]PIJ84896.1 hypothetical protein BLD47_01385 [Erwinia sp. OLCASP19]PIJ86675.1 hypothetical protein BLD46_02985 [Erwinia sp. OLMTSP26]PIJ88116.1 hypothetical protein BLD49_03665 [Erwinia sp. OLMDSP33]